MADGRPGVVLIGHGRSASELLAAARKIAPPDSLEGVTAIDAGEGITEAVDKEICGAVDAADVGAGVLILADLLGSSPCRCGIRQAQAHDVTLLCGLNLAMLLKLASARGRTQGLRALAEACADSARRAVIIQEGMGQAGEGKKA